MINVCRSTTQYVTMVAELNSLCVKQRMLQRTEANAKIILFPAEHCLEPMVHLELCYLGVQIFGELL